MAGRERKPRRVKVAVSAPGRRRERAHRLPWPLAAALGGALVALAGWLLLTAVAVIGWLAAPESDFGAVLGLGTKL